MYQLLGPDEKLIIAATELGWVLAAGLEQADLADIGVIETALARHKARLLARADRQEWDEDYGETISVMDRAG